MSKDEGRRRGVGKGGSDAARGPAPARRRAALIFGLIFVVLFAWVAMADGIGDPSVPSGDVLLVKDTPGDVGKVSVDRLERSMEIAAAQAGEKAAPKPGDPKYEEAKETSMKFILEGIWIQGVADEWGIEVSDEEVEEEFNKVKKESFKTDAEFQKFLKESHYTPGDIKERLKITALSKKLSEKLKEKAPTPSQGEIQSYYDAAKATQFTQTPSRDVRLVVNKDRKKAEEARAALAKDNTAKNWSEVVKKYSEDAETKSTGGLKKGLQEGVREEPVNADIFSTPEGQVEGPVKEKSGYVVFEVVNSTPASVQELKTVESQIKATLTQRAQEEYFKNFVTEFNTQWTQRTFCASGYVIERCANFEVDERSPLANPACYEADPKSGLPEACPAPVHQLIPALPGSVTPLEPTGKALPQRPKPMEEAGEGGEGAAGFPEGALPPTTEAAPPEEAPAEEAPAEEAPAESE